jgi:hypothetical protein
MHAAFKLMCVSRCEEPEKAVQNGSFAIDVFFSHWMHAQYKRKEPFAD